jgi:hypothetical protein
MYLITQTIQFKVNKVKIRSVSVKFLSNLDTPLENQEGFTYFPPMEKVLDKFSNQNWLLRIIFVLMSVLGVHAKYLSSYMGR